MRIHILGARKRTVAPTVIGSWEDGHGHRRVHVLDDSSTTLRQWQSRGQAELYHLCEDPWASLRAGAASDPVEEIEWRTYFMGLQAEAKALGLDAHSLEKAEESRRRLAEELKAKEGKGTGGDHKYSEDQLALARRHPKVFSDNLPSQPQARWPDCTEYARLRLKPGAEPRSRKQYRVPDALRPQLQRPLRSWPNMGSSRFRRAHRTTRPFCSLRSPTVPRCGSVLTRGSSTRHCWITRTPRPRLRSCSTEWCVCSMTLAFPA